MEKKYKTFGLLLLSVLLLLALLSGCRTNVGLGFGFGHKKSSIKLKVSSALPREKTHQWALQGRALVSDDVQLITFTFPKGGGKRQERFEILTECWAT